MSTQFRIVCSCGHNTEKWYDRREDAERDWKMFHQIVEVEKDKDASAMGQHHFFPETRQTGDAGADAGSADAGDGGASDARDDG